MNDLICTIPGCGKPLTNFLGPGTSTLCRLHQVSLIEYGGMGRLERPWTFHRNLVCDWCGYDPAQDKRCLDMDEKDRHVFVRSVLIGDHMTRQADDGSHAKDNIQTLCLLCNAEKGVRAKDYMPSKL